MIFIVLLALSSSKFISSYITMNDIQHWHPLTHFGLALGTGNFTFRARLLDPSSTQIPEKKLQFSIYLAQDWKNVLSRPTCKERMIDAIKTYQVDILPNGEWSQDVFGKLSQKQKPQVWHFVLSDCGRSLGNEKIRYEFSIVNPENEHFSAELIGASKIYWAILALLCIVLGKNSYEFILKAKVEEEFSGPLIWLNISIICQIIGVVFFAIHYYFYSGNGEGVLALEFLGEVFVFLASLTVSCLLIIVAGGWTLIYKAFPAPELVVPGMFLVLFSHMVTIGMDFVGEKTSFSKYEGWKGFTILLVRILMFFWFLWNLYETQKKESIRKGGFIYLFGIGGCLYFLAIPLLVFGGFMFPVHLREMIMIGGSHFAQTAICYFLVMVFSGKGEYHKMNSVLNILPGSKIRIY